MTSTVTNPVKAATLIALALAIGTTGIFIAEVDDPSLPGLGPAGIGMLLMIVGVVLGLRTARNRLPQWAARTALAVGVLVAALAAFLIHGATIAAPLFAQPQDMPSAMDSTPSQPHAAAVERARELVRAAVLAQNLPGVSVAVGAGLPSEALAKEGGRIVWAEGFGWRDVETRTPVTPATRFNIGTAAPAVSASVAALGLSDTGTDAAREWSPGAVGEEGEDFPPLTLLRHILWQPLGLMAPEYPLPGDRATFYVPRSDGNPLSGRRLMYMRDLACCAGGMAFYSTPSDLVRFALATNADSVNGELAGGRVMSLTTRRENAIAVAVTSNISHAKTAALALQVADVFADDQ